MKIFLKIIYLLISPKVLYLKLSKLFAEKRILVFEIWDYVRYRKRYKSLVNDRISFLPTKDPLLFVFGRGMNLTWAQIWIYLSLDIFKSGTKIQFLISPARMVIGLYLNILRPELVSFSHLRALAKDENIPRFCPTQYDYTSVHGYYHDNLPVGQIILSTFARYNLIGEVDVNDEKFIEFFKEWEPIILETYYGARKLFSRNKYSAIVFTETFCEDYGSIYFAALALELNIVKTSGTVQDAAILVQRRNKYTARLSHATLSRNSWEKIRNNISAHVAISEVRKNFSDRYGRKWFRSARNNNNSININCVEARNKLGLREDRKIAIIFSHILYDALFHYGEELYRDYAEWLVRTIELAIKNENLDWFIKYHPSNIWRGELNSVLKGRYEEDRLIDKFFPSLPPHVRKIYPSTDLSAWTWMKLADVGVCVRSSPGLEMACLGKPVISAGTGRYEGYGFTRDPKSIAEYENMISRAHELAPLSEDETNAANIFAHGLFNLKPFALDGLVPMIASGKRSIKQSDDMIYLPDSIAAAKESNSPKRFSEFLFDSDDELLSGI